MAKRVRITTDLRAEEKFASYPRGVRGKMKVLRKQILSAARKCADVEEVHETLKWGEPSYLTPIGSTVRIDWKEKAPDQVAIYFKCTSKLVATFREVYGDTFRYEKNRAILFGLDEDIASDALTECIQAALRYHKVKALENLGIQN